jgi:hypothetical protein
MGNDKGGAGYEHLLYECQRQKTSLERRIQELEARIERLKKENAGIKALLESRTAERQHNLRRPGPLGKPIVW